MATPTNRTQLKEYALRKLGHPVIQINVDDSQLEDRMDEALQYYAQFHFDATERTYLKHQVDATDIANGYITIDEDIIAVNRVFSISSDSTASIFNVKYQFMLNEVTNLNRMELTHYHMTKQHLNMLQAMLSGEKPLRFNRHTDRIYLDIDWDGELTSGDYLVFEVYTKLDPDTYTDVYDDMYLKKYVTVLFKEQWALNLIKFGNLQLPGGVVYNGQEMYQQAQEEKQRLEEEMRTTWEEPIFAEIG